MVGTGLKPKHFKPPEVCLWPENWPALKTRIESAGLLDLWDAATELSSDDPNFLAFLSNLSAAEKALLATCTKE